MSQFYHSRIVCDSPEFSALLDDKTITPQNVFESKADERFMRKYYPYEDYTPNPISTKTHGHTIASLCKGDIKSTLLEAVFRMTVKPAEPATEIKEQTKKKIRDLIMKKRTADENKQLIAYLQRHSLKTEVNEDNYEDVARRFIKVYYPTLSPARITNQIPSHQPSVPVETTDLASSRSG